MIITIDNIYCFIYSSVESSKMSDLNIIKEIFFNMFLTNLAFLFNQMTGTLLVAKSLRVRNG